jgi:hypothetical protein
LGLVANDFLFSLLPFISWILLRFLFFQFFLSFQASRKQLLDSELPCKADYLFAICGKLPLYPIYFPFWSSINFHPFLLFSWEGLRGERKLLHPSGILHSNIPIFLQSAFGAFHLSAPIRPSFTPHIGHRLEVINICNLQFKFIKLTHTRQVFVSAFLLQETCSPYCSFLAFPKPPGVVCHRINFSSAILYLTTCKLALAYLCLLS